MFCFTTLPPLSPVRLENVKLPSSDTDVAPPYVVRAIFMYGRSYSMPVYKNNLDVSDDACVAPSCFTSAGVVCCIRGFHLVRIQLHSARG